MKYSMILLVSASYLFFSGCARDNAVAMNLYDPSSGQVEKASGVSVVITKEMIANMKKRRAATRKVYR